MARKSKNGNKKAIIVSLGVISIIGFLSIFLREALVININDILTNVVFLVFGLGLMFMGNVGRMMTFTSNGLTGVEILSLISISVGIITLLVGILSFSPNFLISEEVNSTIRITISALAILIITFQTIAVLRVK